MTHQAQTLQAHSNAFHESEAGLLKQWWRALWARRAERVAVRMLSALDDRTLHDIGMHRSEIGSLVYGRPKEHRQTFTVHR